MTSTLESNKTISKRFPEGLYDLVQKSIQELGDIPELEETTFEEKEFIKTKKWVTKHD
jgi:hypothetical protein